jgi:hypothetical protein
MAKGPTSTDQAAPRGRFLAASEREAALDEALAESFPASDSPSLARSGERVAFRGKTRDA